MSEQEDKLSATIPDFFFELIGRIAPGIFVIMISIFWSGKCCESLFSSIGESALVLTGAWIIGIFLDAGVYYSGNFLLDKFPRIKKVLKNKPIKILQDFPPDLDRRAWRYFCKASAWERGVILKQNAQCIFFRNMMVVCFLVVVICVVMEFHSRFDALLPVLHCHHRCYLVVSFVCFLVFLLSWHKQRECLRTEWDELTKSSVMREESRTSALPREH